VVSDRELELLLRGLAEGDGAPGADPLGSVAAGSELAGGALQRARTRRRRRTTVTTVAAALAVLTVATGVEAGVRLRAHEQGGRVPLPGGTADGGWGRERENVLLLGTDAATDNGSGTTRPDSIVVASIDTHTGDTLLVSLPRNLQRVPFPPGSPGERAFPQGFHCVNAQQVNADCLLYALWTWGQDHPQDYPGDPHPGLTATRQGVEQVTGLTIDDWLVLDLRGFARVVDAVGGVDVTITRRLPIGGDAAHPVASDWLEPGRQHLDGYHALWFARSHWSSSDYDRMARQRCLVSALARQVDAGTVAARLPALIGALRGDVLTSVTLSDLPRWVALLQRIRSGRIRTLVLTDQVINPVHPDVPLIRQLVRSGVTGSPLPAASGSAAYGSGTRPAAGGVVPQDAAVCQG
jgi:LCP family protein required for cell wall assembly